MNNSRNVVIVVEDDASVRVSLARLLASANLQYLMFESAEDFLELVDPAVTGVAVLDVHLPGITGLDLQKIIAARYAQLGVVIMSAFEDAQAEQRSVADGAIAFLHKPFEPDALLRL